MAKVTVTPLPPKREWVVTFSVNGVRITTIVKVREGNSAIDAARLRIAEAYDVPLRLLRGGWAESPPAPKATEVA